MNKNERNLLISFFTLIGLDLLGIAYFFYKGHINFPEWYKHVLLK